MSPSITPVAPRMQHDHQSLLEAALPLPEASATCWSSSSNVTARSSPLERALSTANATRGFTIKSSAFVDGKTKLLRRPLPEAALLLQWGRRRTPTENVLWPSTSDAAANPACPERSPHQPSARCPKTKRSSPARRHSNTFGYRPVRITLPQYAALGCHDGSMSIKIRSKLHWGSSLSVG